MSKVAMLYDASKCTACRGCQVACKQWNDLGYVKTVNRGSYENPPDLSPSCWTKIKFREQYENGRMEWLFLAQGCMHCTDAACVNVCPTGALKHESNGIVSLDRNLCNGCGYCTQFCPFHIPRLDAEILTGKAKSFKCTFCQDRTPNGQVPACVKTCPSGAFTFGDREAKAAEGLERVALLQKSGWPEANLYGNSVLGGLGRMYVLQHDPKDYGLPINPVSPAVSAIWQKWVQPLAEVSFAATAVAAVGAFLVARRHIRMEEVE
jgi:formate dehydrogenase iron-sulfur subunit